MITPATIAWLVLFVAAVAAARSLIARWTHPTAGVPAARALAVLTAALIPGLMAAGSVVQNAVNSGGGTAGAIVGGVFTVAVGGVVGLLLGPAAAALGAEALGDLLLGRPSDRALKETKSFDKARALAVNNKPEEAVAEYRRELATDPTQWRGARDLADLLEKIGRADEAITELRRALPHVDDVEQRLLVEIRVVDLLCKLGKIEAARTHLEELEKRPWPPRLAKAIRSRRQRLPP